MVIRELRVSGYRSIRELRVPLGSLNVLTGPNGCGKSNLYNSVFLLAKVASKDFARGNPGTKPGDRRNVYCYRVPWLDWLAWSPWTFRIM